MHAYNLHKSRNRQKVIARQNRGSYHSPRRNVAHVASVLPDQRTAMPDPRDDVREHVLPGAVTSLEPPNAQQTKAHHRRSPVFFRRSSGV
jgi:hypothetical protein